MATNVAYPLGDLLLVGFVIGAVALTGWRPGRGFVLIALGLAVNAIANGIYLYRDATGRRGRALAGRLAVAAVGAAAGARRLDPATRSRALRLEGRRLLAIPSFFAAVAVGLQVYNQFAPVNRFAAGFATATLGVVIVRMALLFSDHLTLLAVSQPGVAVGPRHRARQPPPPDARPRGGDRGRRGRTSFALFDLDGFKAYNDSFGHPAGDALLCRLGENLAAAVQPSGSAYRLGGDEFCVLVPIDGPDGDGVVAVGSAALSEAGKAFSISSSSGSVLLPDEADDASTALLLADRRMYAQKRLRSHSAERQTRNVLLRILREREPDLDEHLRSVASLAVLLAPPCRARGRGARRGRARGRAARRRQDRDPRARAAQARAADGGRARADPQAHPDRRAHPRRGPGDGAGRAARALEPRALGRRRLPRSAARRGDPARRAHHRRLRRLRRDGVEEALPAQPQTRRGAGRAAALRRAPSSIPRLVELFCEQVLPAGRGLGSGALESQPPWAPGADGAGSPQQSSNSVRLP